jgi:hypothetical protein
MMERLLASAYLVFVVGLLWLMFNTATVFGQDNPNCHEWGLPGGIPVQCLGGGRLSDAPAMRHLFAVRGPSAI